MNEQSYTLPLNGYYIFDYMGDTHIEYQTMEKQKARAIFESFLQELPTRLFEFRKIVPSHIALNYTYQSLQELDVWLNSLCRDYRENYFDKKNDDTTKYALPTILRSIANDSSIYFIETLRRCVMNDMVWEEGYYRKGQATGHPLVKSAQFHQCSEIYMYQDKWPASKAITQGLANSVRYYDEADDWIGKLDKFYKIMLNLGDWQAVVPEKYRYPKF